MEFGKQLSGGTLSGERWRRNNQMNDNEFYEEDEPIEEIVAAFESGEHGTTEQPVTFMSFRVVAESANRGGETILRTSVVSQTLMSTPDRELAETG
jgi:hypothetical protein